jgi:hypothetical protein
MKWLVFGLLLVACTKAVPLPPDAGQVAAVAEAAAPPVDTTAAADAAPAPTLATTTTAPHVHDAGVAMCCCQAGQKLANLSMAECVGSFHGSCVHDDICSAKSCCCDVNGKKTHQLQSDCSHQSGKCVKKDQCS